ncbi:MAG TPA: tRNA (guanosine(37)-N1)-methyltransferase TrmD, partial [Chthonomonadales bacterium]|nr:tRNA (guanosine(37)-N1)-methyltransferase TrmD [Chthonomonadales bacterium]
MMRIDVITIFPEMIEAVIGCSILRRAREVGIVDIRAVNLRDFAPGRHHTTDDTPYGGGGGMIMMVEPIARALDALRPAEGAARVILTDPQGERFDQAKARELAQEQHLILLCGHYEGVDERVRQHLVTDEISIGDYVLTGGELPALVIIDAVVRLLPGVLGDAEAAQKDSFSEGLLDYPHYTRPRSFRGWEVPEILFSGHHARIRRWRRWHQLERTRERRPDLWARFVPTEEDLKLWQ